MIDCAKGVSISLVVLGHTKLITQALELNAFLGLVRMPLFFFLAGLFLRPHRTVMEVAVRKADSLLKPYFVTLAAIGLLGWPSEGSDPLEYLLGVLYGTGHTIALLPLWFLTHLWLLHLFATFFVRLIDLHRRPSYVSATVIAMLLAAGSIAVHSFWPVPLTLLGGRVNTGLPFSMDLLPLSSGFFLLGFVLRKQVMAYTPKASWVALATVAFLMASMVFDPRMDMNNRVLQAPVFALVCAIAGIYLVMTTCHLLCRVREFQRLFTYLGSMSLFVLIFHLYMQQVWAQFLHAVAWDYVSSEALIMGYLAALMLSAALGSLIVHTPVISKFYVPTVQFKTVTKATN